MFVVRHLHLATWEVFKWLAILTLASMIAATAARLASGDAPANPSGEPRPLPKEMLEAAQPMNPAAPPVIERDTLQGAAQQVWQILEQERTGNHDEALKGWQRAALACTTEEWRHIAMGQAALGMRDLTAARDHLEAALCVDHTNAVAHYYLGILRLEQAAKAKEWPDALGPHQASFVVHRTKTHEPALTRSMYQLAARVEFETALEFAGQVPFDEPLCDPAEGATVALEPTVRDLLIAMRAEDFAAKAHHMLAYLVMEHGSAEEAEQHLDAAAAQGQAIVFGYQDLAAVYERNHQRLDAMRANAKAVAQGNTLARPAESMLRNLRLAIIEESSGLW